MYAARNAASAARPTACVEPDGIEESAAQRSLIGLPRHPPSQMQTPNEEFNSLSRQFSVMSHSEVDAGAINPNPNANANTPLLSVVAECEHASSTPSGRYSSLHQSEHLEEQQQQLNHRMHSTLRFAQSDTHAHFPNDNESPTFRPVAAAPASAHNSRSLAHQSPHHLNICSELENFPPMYPAGRIVQIIEERVAHGYSRFNYKI